MRLAGKVAIVTGGASGFGRASAVLFAREGAKVVVTDIEPEGGEDTVMKIKEAGGEAVFVQANVARAEDVQRMVNTAVQTYGRLDILFNNAGVAGPTGLEEVTEEAWDRLMDVNLKGVFFGMKYAAPEMKKSGGGSIISTSSAAGLNSSPRSPAYAASKAGVVVLTRSVARILARHKIRVNCVCPGVAETGLLSEFLNLPGGRDRAREGFLRAIPMRRFGQPEEIANVVLFLASDESSYMTGVALPIDGGMSLV